MEFITIKSPPPFGEYFWFTFSRHRISRGYSNDNCSSQWPTCWILFGDNEYALPEINSSPLKIAKGPKRKFIWSNYSDLTRPISPKRWWIVRQIPFISGKSILVNIIYNLARCFQSSGGCCLGFVFSVNFLGILPWNASPFGRIFVAFPTIHFQVTTLNNSWSEIIEVDSHTMFIWKGEPEPRKKTF